MSKTGNIEVRVCGCNKYCYPSESAAQRALNSYDDLVRYYECPDDNTYFHTTKAEKYVEITKTKDLEKKVENLELTIEGLERRLRTIGTINKKNAAKNAAKIKHLHHIIEQKDSAKIELKIKYGMFKTFLNKNFAARIMFNIFAKIKKREHEKRKENENASKVKEAV